MHYHLLDDAVTQLTVELEGITQTDIRLIVEAGAQKFTGEEGTRTP